MAASQPGPKYNGWWRDPNNSNRLAFYKGGTKIGHLTAAAFVTDKVIQATGGVTAVTGDLTATAGNGVITAGDLRVTAGNARLGAVSAFGTTEPTSAVVMKTGTAPVGAITTSGGVFASSTVVRKIIADGTVSNVET